jgi:hypothetical protein
MALTSKIISELKAGGKKMVIGSWTSNSTTGGDIETGLMVIENVVLVPNKSSVASTQTVLNETLPLNGSKFTIITPSSVDGYWEAIGE